MDPVDDAGVTDKTAEDGICDAEERAAELLMDGTESESTIDRDEGTETLNNAEDPDVEVTDLSDTIVETADTGTEETATEDTAVDDTRTEPLRDAGAEEICAEEAIGAGNEEGALDAELPTEEIDELNGVDVDKTADDFGTEVTGILCDGGTEDTAEIDIGGALDTTLDTRGIEADCAELDDRTVNGVEILTGATIDETTETLRPEETCDGEERATSAEDSGIEERRAEEICPADERRDTDGDEVNVKVVNGTEILADDGAAELNDTI
jgi:hypothetical protein